MNFECWAVGTWAANSWVVGSWCPGAEPAPAHEPDIHRRTEVRIPLDLDGKARRRQREDEEILLL